VCIPPGVPIIYDSRLALGRLWQLYTRHRIRQVVMPARRMIDRILPTAGRASLQGEELRVQPGQIRQLEAAGVQECQWTASVAR
jgi:hypothetical protein